MALAGGGMLSEGITLRALRPRKFRARRYFGVAGIFSALEPAALVRASMSGGSGRRLHASETVPAALLE